MSENARMSVNMRPLAVLRNTYIMKKEKPKLDLITKIIIITENFIGINRVTLLTELKWAKLMLVLHCVLVLALLSTMTYLSYTPLNCLTLGVEFFEYMFCSLSMFKTTGIMRLFFIEINRFDKEANFSPKTKEILKSTLLLQCIYLVVFISLTCLFIYDVSFSETPQWYLLPSQLIYFSEIYFYAHLFRMISVRVRIINDSLQLSLLESAAGEVSGQKGQQTQVAPVLCYEIKKLMNLYVIISIAQKHVIDSVKWQFLVLIKSNFLKSLVIVYVFSLYIIKAEVITIQVWQMVYFIYILATILPLIVPCTYGDVIQNEVRRLKKLLASRLYENNMDKDERRVARCLLALMQEHDLTLSLLGLVKVDITLPLKFISLLISYLIILLQFRKVINA